MKHSRLLVISIILLGAPKCGVGGEDAGRDAGIVNVRPHIDGGESDLCALVSRGLWCWGKNWYGALGFSYWAPLARRVPINGITRIDAGDAVSCGVFGGGGVRCWGDNSFCSLGNPAGEGPIPVPVLDLPPADDVVVSLQPIALCGGGLWRWGGTLDASSCNAQRIWPDINDAVGIFIAPAWCFIRADRSLWCFGDNYSGQLGDGTTEPRDHPVEVVGLHDVEQASGANEDGCAREADGSVWCWGPNYEGVHGDGTLEPSLVPKQIPNLRAKQISISRYHGCAALVDGTAVCWGANESGQLGDGSMDGSLVPMPVVGLQNVREVATTYGGACALLEDESVYCWGDAAPYWIRKDADPTLPVAVPLLDELPDGGI